LKNQRARIKNRNKFNSESTARKSVQQPTKITIKSVFPFYHNIEKIIKMKRRVLIVGKVARTFLEVFSLKLFLLFQFTLENVALIKFVVQMLLFLTKKN